jgi:hypothetical protein
MFKQLRFITRAEAVAVVTALSIAVFWRFFVSFAFSIASTLSKIEVFINAYKTPSSRLYHAEKFKCDVFTKFL